MAPLVLWCALVLAVPAAAQSPTPSPLQVVDLPADAPLALTAERIDLQLRVHVDLRQGWHLYGRDTGNGKPVQVTVADGAFAAAGPLVTPMAANGEIQGKATLELPLRRIAAGDALTANLQFMVCDALECLPPMTVTLRAAAPRLLLCAIDDGERTTRIATFLQHRGFAVTTTTYDKVTAAECDAHDLVLADSPTFGQARGKAGAARKFPATGSPIVAVGFLGTELLEAQRVSMACGYI